MHQYAGRYVALRQREVVVVADNEAAPLTAASRQFLGELVYVRLVIDQPLPRLMLRRPLLPG
jgi:hypothetical protein